MLRTAVIGLLLLLVPVLATAGAPSIPALSTVDSALVLCPAGDMAFHAIARIQGGVLAFRVNYMYVDITNCPGLRLEPIPTSSDAFFANNNGLLYVAQACYPAGSATFWLRGGGSGTGVVLPVLDSHQLTVLATRTTFLSPDQSGDLIVDALDLAMVRSKLGMNDPTADFNFDGVVNQADVDTVTAHMGHAGSRMGPVATSRGSWGRIKALYR